MKVMNAPICERREALLDFVYGELGNAEAKQFQKHLHECAACSEDLAAFRGVRNSLISWRDETLGASTVPNTAVLHDRRSALAALRAFFDFSPLWLKGAVAVAVLVFCVLVGLSVRDVPSLNPTIASNGPIAPATTDFNAAVERSVKEKLAALNQPTRPEEIKSPAVPQRIVKIRNARTNTSNPLQVAQRPLSRSERAELAADLRLVSSHHENETDLLDDGINR